MKINTSKLRIEMAKKNINQKNLALLSNVRPATINFILNDKSNGSPKTWGKIAEALKIDVTELIEY